MSRSLFALVWILPAHVALAAPPTLPPVLAEIACETGLQCYHQGKSSHVRIRALELYRRACKLGEANGCLSIGLMIQQKKLDVHPEPPELLALYDRACKVSRVAAACSYAKELRELIAAVPRCKRTCPKSPHPESSWRQFVWLRVLCDRGNGEACHALAARYGGQYFSSDWEKVMATLARACRLGVRKACAERRQLRRRQRCRKPETCVHPDRYRGLSSYRDVLTNRLQRAACKRGNVAQCFALAQCDMGYGCNKGVIDTQRALDRLVKLCNTARHRPSCTLAAQTIVGMKHHARRVEDAAYYFKRGCHPDEPMACLALMDFHALVPQFTAPLADLYRYWYATCPTGKEIYCIRASACMEREAQKMHAKRPGEALAIWRRACFSKLGRACLKVPQLCQDQPLCLRVAEQYSTYPLYQPKVAAALYERLCTRGHKQACGRLATMISKGQGMPKDLAKARALYQRACDAGYAGSCEKLAKSFARGSEDAYRAHKKGCALKQGMTSRFACLAVTIYEANKRRAAQQALRQLPQEPKIPAEDRALLSKCKGLAITIRQTTWQADRYKPVHQYDYVRRGFRRRGESPFVKTCTLGSGSYCSRWSYLRRKQVVWYERDKHQDLLRQLKIAENRYAACMAQARRRGYSAQDLKRDLK